MTNLDFPDWSEARSIANEISEIGAPLLRLTRNLGFQSGSNVLGANAGINLFGTVAIDQPGYEAQFTLWYPANSGTMPFAQLTITWIDSVSGQSVATDTFFMTGGNAQASALTYYISGPAKGDKVIFNLQNLDPVQNLSYSFTAGVNSHIYTWDRILQPSYGATAPNGFTNPAGTPGVGLIAIMSPLQTPGNTSSRLLAVYNGKVRLNVDNLGQANPVRVTLQDPSTLYSAVASGNFFADVVINGGTFSTEFVLPNGPVLLTTNNTGGSGNITPTVSVIKEEY